MKLSDTTLIILAAGKSSRMGHPKGLINYQGKFILEHHRDNFLKAGGGQVLVVLGSFLPEYFAALPWIKKNCLINHNVEQGPFSSLQIALRELTPDSQGQFILPVDVPTSPGIWNIANNFSTEVLIPCFEGKGGHPILISTHFAKSLLLISPDAQEARLDRQIQKLPKHLVERFEVNDPLVIKNFNTVNDL